MPISKPSKSARKREFLALQALGECLIDLSTEELDALSLDERLLDAVLDAKSMKAHGALRRQRQLIGKLMRDVDAAPIRLALDAMNSHDNLAKDVFRDAERWRDRIVQEGPAALPEFFALIEGESPSLIDLANSYTAATHEKKRLVIRRQIFGEIHKALATKMQRASS